MKQNYSLINVTFALQSRFKLSIFLFPLWRAIRNRFRPRSNEISQTELAVHERTFTATSGLLRAVQNILASATACLVNCNAANGGINSFTRDGSRVHPFTGGAIREK